MMKLSKSENMQNYNKSRFQVQNTTLQNIYFEKIKQTRLKHLEALKLEFFQKHHV